MLKVGYWRMLSGQVIRIRDMTDEHLLNALRMMYRRYDSLKLLFEIEVQTQQAYWHFLRVSELEREVAYRGLSKEDTKP